MYQEEAFLTARSAAVHKLEETSQLDLERVICENMSLSTRMKLVLLGRQPVTNAIKSFTVAFLIDKRFLSGSFIYKEKSAYHGIIMLPINQLSCLSHGIQAH